MSKFFTNYLHFAQSAQEINKRYKVSDQKERLVLEAVLTAHMNGAVFGVLDLVLLEDIASQATLHSVMKDLISKKLIKTEVSKQDARRKHVLPTKQGLAWLKDISDVLAAAHKK